MWKWLAKNRISRWVSLRFYYIFMFLFVWSFNAWKWFFFFVCLWECWFVVVVVVVNVDDERWRWWRWWCWCWWCFVQSDYQIHNYVIQLSVWYSLCVLFYSIVLLYSSLLLLFSCVFFLPVPPIIEPFSFQDGLAEGMRTRTVCGVSRGDAPLNLRWLKDGEPLPSILGANVTSLDQYSSLLSIPSLTAKHSGDYTCVATNPAAEFRYTASLQVKGTVCPYKLAESLHLQQPKTSPRKRTLKTHQNTNIEANSSVFCCCRCCCHSFWILVSVWLVNGMNVLLMWLNVFACEREIRLHNYFYDTVAFFWCVF